MATLEILPGTELIINKIKCVAVVDHFESNDIFESCNECILCDEPDCAWIACLSGYRSDGKSIHFEKVI